MGGGEDVGALDAQPDQRVDVEEAPVAEFLIGSAPVGQPVILQVEKFVQRVDIVVEIFDGARDGRWNFALLGEPPARRQPSPPIRPSEYSRPVEHQAQRRAARRGSDQPGNPVDDRHGDAEQQDDLKAVGGAADRPEQAAMGAEEAGAGHRDQPLEHERVGQVDPEGAGRARGAELPVRRAAVAPQQTAAEQRPAEGERLYHHDRLENRARVARRRAEAVDLDQVRPDARDHAHGGRQRDPRDGAEVTAGECAELLEVPAGECARDHVEHVAVHPDALPGAVQPFREGPGSGPSQVVVDWLRLP